MKHTSNALKLSERRDLDLRRELERRGKYLELFATDPLFRRDALMACSVDPVYFINNWCWTFDPRLEPGDFPFKLFPKQEEAVRFLYDRYKKGEVGVVEKSRDMGATWIAVAFTLWGFLFEKGFVVRWGSTTVDEVDDMTIDSIMGKVRYILEKLPPMMRPKMAIDKRLLMMKDYSSNNTIIGEATGPTFGRSGREKITFIDEYAFIKHSEAVWSSISQTSNTKVVISTPNGEDNQFYWLATNKNIPKISLHWSDHPYKDDAWYEEQKKKMKKWQVAQEIDIDYTASKEGRIYSRFDRKYHVAKKVIRYDRLKEQGVSWDFGFGGAMAIVFFQVSAEGTVEVWGYIEVAEQDIEFCLPLSMGYRLEGSAMIQLTHEEKEHIDTTLEKVPQGHRCVHYGDHAGTARTANSRRSCKDHIVSQKLTFKSKGKQQHDYRHLCMGELLKVELDPRTGEPRSKFLISPDLPRLITCFNNYVWDKDIETGKAQPKIDEFSHGVTACEFMAINRFPVERNKKPRVRVMEISR